MINILVTGVGGNIGLGIIKSLKLSSLKCRIIGIDIRPLAAGLYRCDKGYIVPRIDDPHCIARIIDICHSERINAILVGSDIELEFFSLNRDKIERESGAKVVINNPRVINIGRDKWKTHNFLKENNLNFCASIIPADSGRYDDILSFAHKIGYPVIIKPRITSGSRDFHIIEDDESLIFFLKRIVSPIIQEYLASPDEEYTCGTFTDSSGSLKGIITMKRTLKGGDTDKVLIDNYPAVEEEAIKLIQALGSTGACNIQMRLTDKGPVAFEINPRFSGTAAIRAAYGFNEVEWSVRHFVLGEDLRKKRHSKGIAVRYLNEVYIPYKDYEKLKIKGKIGCSKSVIQSYL